MREGIVIDTMPVFTDQGIPGKCIELLDTSKI